MPVPWSDGSYAWCRPSARCSTGKDLGDVVEPVREVEVGNGDRPVD
jgi:hypothetical protein